MGFHELHDRGRLETWLRRDPAMHLYELGDLDDLFWPRTRWYGLGSAGEEPRAVALLYAAVHRPVLVIQGRDADRESSRALLAALVPLLPAVFDAHLVPGTVDVLGDAFVVEPYGVHERMVLADRSRVAEVDTSSACRLGSSDGDEVRTLYREAYPNNWFDAAMLETGMYFGVRESGVLASIAGVHVVSRRYRVAALGNVATLPAARGRGLGRVVTAAVCKALDGIDPIGLNVEIGNEPAIRVYRALGFERASSFDEVRITRRR